MRRSQCSGGKGILYATTAGEEVFLKILTFPVREPRKHWTFMVRKEKQDFCEAAGMVLIYGSTAPLIKSTWM